MDFDPYESYIVINAKLKGLLLTEGMHGMISQEKVWLMIRPRFYTRKIEPNNFWKWIPPKITPVQSSVFKNKIKEKFDVVISKKERYTFFIFEEKFAKIMTSIQNPKVSLNNLILL